MNRFKTLVAVDKRNQNNRKYETQRRQCWFKAKGHVTSHDHVTKLA